MLLRDTFAWKTCLQGFIELDSKHQGNPASSKTGGEGAGRRSSTHGRSDRKVYILARYERHSSTVVFTIRRRINIACSPYLRRTACMHPSSLDVVSSPTSYVVMSYLDGTLYQ